MTCFFLFFCIEYKNIIKKIKYIVSKGDKMKRRNKIIVSILACVCSICLMCFGVYALTTKLYLQIFDGNAVAGYFFVTIICLHSLIFFSVDESAGQVACQSYGTFAVFLTELVDAKTKSFDFGIFKHGLLLKV